MQDLMQPIMILSTSEIVVLACIVAMIPSQVNRMQLEVQAEVEKRYLES